MSLSRVRRWVSVCSAVIFALGFAVIAASCTSLPSNVLPRPARGAFVYPWFPEAWNQQGFNPFTNYTPSRGFYDSSSVSTIDGQIDDLQSAGMQFGILSWWGQGSQTDARITPILNETSAHASSFDWTLYYEPEGTGNPTSAQIDNDLTYIASHYGSNPRYAHYGGRPVLFVYGDPGDRCGMVDRWKAASNTSKFYVVMKVFGGYASCANQPDNWHQYGPAVAEDAQGTHSFTISPGFWKKGCQPVNNGACAQGGTAPYLARDPARWAQNVADMKASRADFELVTTYNEWGEGTSVESASEWQSSSGLGIYQDELRNQLVFGNPGGTTTSSATSTTSPPSTTSSTSSSTSTPTTASTTTTTTTVASSSTTTTTVASSSTTTTAPGNTSVCNNGATPPTTYQHVVIFAMENRTWSNVGLGFNASSMPYLHSLAQQCTYFSTDTEADTSQNSATQYVSQVVGFNANSGSTPVANDCSPSFTSCGTSADNIFRQLTAAGKTAVNYVEGATSTCSASGNAAKHIPALYLYNPDGSRPNCNTWVQPYTSFDVNNMPNLAFITPTLCNDGHDCSDGTVDSWSSTNVRRVLDSTAYRSGNTIVYVWYDEDHPKPNLTIAPTALAGDNTAFAESYTTTLRAWEAELGVPCLSGACGAADERAASRT